MFFSGMFKEPRAGQSGAIGVASARGSSSGITVTAEAAMAQSAVFRCVSLLSESMAKIPCELYRRSGDESREKAKDHPLYTVLRHKPNSRQSAFEYFESGQGWLGIGGNHYSLIERNSKMQVAGLIPVHKDNVTVLKGDSGNPFYRLKGSDKLLGMNNMHHVRALSLDGGYTGLSPIMASPDTIGLALASELHAAKSFANGTQLSGVIERPKDVEKISEQSSIDKIVNTFISRHAGINNMFSVALLQEGMTFKQAAMTNEQAQLIEARRLSVEDISRLYGIPLVLLNHNAGESYKSVEQNSQNFLTFTLLSWVKRWEAAMQRDLLLDEELADYIIEFNVSTLIRADIETRYKSYALGRQWGWLSVNDIRRMENLPPVPGGEIYLQPLNMVDASKADMHSMIEQANDEQLQEIRALCRN